LIGVSLQASKTPHGRQLMTLPEQIAERILAAIASGEFAPGERIHEDRLAAMLEVSRGPVREALRILEKDSVVRIQPHRGTHVTQLSIQEVSDIFEIRLDLAGAMLRRLTRCDEAFVAMLDTEVRELERLADKPGASDDYLIISHRLGRALADYCGNRRRAEFLESLARQTRRYAMLGLASTARRIESVRSWRALVSALQAGDFDAASTAIEALIGASHTEAVRQLRAASQTDTRPAAGLALAPA
jgi:DNA-binding GntR family transcriptional regulator